MFIEHKSLKPLSSHMGAFLLKGFEGLKGEDANFFATPVEIFSSNVYGRVIELDNCLEAMRIAIFELNSIAKSPTSSAKMFRYHYENYVLRLAGLLDRAYRLVGVVLEIPDAKLSKIGSNATVLKTSLDSVPPVHAQLLVLRELLAERSKARNDIAHSSVYSSKELGLFTVVEQIELSAIDPKQVHELRVHHFSTEIVDIDILTVRAEAALNKLLNLLGLPIRRRVKRDA